MKNTGIFYGSSTGCCHAIAEMVRVEMAIPPSDMYDISHTGGEILTRYENLILGISTWENGSLQEDWKNFLLHAKSLNLKDKRVAIYGTGDQENYPNNFADAMGLLYDSLLHTGCIFVGSWPADDYSFIQSKAYCNGKFIGLVIDEDTQSYYTTWRVKQWVKQLRYEFSFAEKMMHSAMSGQCM